LAQLLNTNRLTCDGNPFVAKIILLVVAQKALKLASWPIIFIYILITAQIQPWDIIRNMSSRVTGMSHN